MGALVRSAALGLAAGGRAAVGVAVPVLAATAGRRGAGATLARTAARAALAGEAVTDKLPGLPSRLVPPMLVARVLSGAGGAVALALVERRRVPVVVLAGAAGAAGAFAGAVGGASWREWAAEHGPAFLSGRAAGLAEDALVLATAGTLVATSR
ncbi:hypothetical protein [Cellulomonas shaoxiangyii]|uniref:DUF4126 domain-containing protein n=1 Tax=Cellulomonas shaoxiangyii TaxID=2566013 RepID=A0A4P7SNM0_9CELL|nr:hypothetical protein [Cellulomonas shaoxiangyii]QCB94866.1 hypothetical protein E5225_16175 [Cellulomonas shaoxiangyii]TGY85095.1 hypothetical protein E5226_08040 [Cellulomonas shaoxiangyii]